MKAIETSCSFPLSFDADGEVKSFNQFPIDVTAMKESTGYYQSLNSDIEVIAVSQTKAHIILRKALRVKQDGTPIESVSGFYIWVKLDGVWKMKFASAITLQQNYPIQRLLVRGLWHTPRSRGALFYLYTKVQLGDAKSNEKAYLNPNKRNTILSKARYNLFQ